MLIPVKAIPFIFIGTLFTFAPFVAFTPYDMLHPDKAFGPQTQPIWPWVIVAVVVNLLAVGLLVYFCTRSAQWRMFDYSRWPLDFNLWLHVCGGNLVWFLY